MKLCVHLIAHALAITDKFTKKFEKWLTVYPNFMEALSNINSDLTQYYWFKELYKIKKF